MATPEGGGQDLSRSQLNAGDELFIHYCTPCQNRNKNRAASKYCAVCSEYMCGECVDNHNSFKSLSKHALVDVSQIQVSSSSTTTSDELLSVPTEMCKKHPMKVMDMYCENDDYVGCSVCIAPHYKSCSGVHYIPEYVKSVFIAAENNQTITDLTACIASVSALKKLQKDLKKKLTNDKSACKQKLKIEIKKLVDKLEEASLKELDEAYRETGEDIANRIKNIENMATELARLKSEMETTHGNDAQQFAITKICQEMITKSVMLTSELHMVEKNSLEFDVNTTILQQMQQYESLQKRLEPATSSNDAPEFALAPGPADKDRRHPSKDVDSDLERKTPTPLTDTDDEPIDATAESTSNVPMLYEVQNMYKRRVRIPSDQKTCRIDSISVLGNGNLILADSSNNVLKVFDMNTHKITYSLGLSKKPNRICNVNDNEVAVSLCGYVILFVDTKDKLAPIREIATNCSCYGLVVIDNKLYVCDDDTSVQVYTMNGELIKTMRYRSSTGSNLNLLYNNIVSVSDKSIIITCDPVGLSAFNMGGKSIWQHKNKSDAQAEGQTAVCRDGRRYLFVSGFVTGNVVLVNERSGAYIKEVVARRDGLTCPTAVSYDEKKQELVVGIDTSDDMCVFSF